MLLDETIREEILFGLDELANRAEQPVSRDKDGWILFEGEGACKFTWRPPMRRDFEPFDLISISLRVEAPEWGLNACIVVESVDPATGRPNQYHVGTSGPRTVQGEFRFDFPYENWHINGFPSGWKNITEFSFGAALRHGGRIAFGPVYLVQRKRAPGPRLTDEELFFDELNLEHPGLESVREAVQRRDLEAAARALLDYYANRKSVRHPYGTNRRENRWNRRVADDFMEGIFMGQRVGEPIDWRANPNGYLEWRHAFNRHYVLGALFWAWRETGDGRYLSRLDEALTRWLAVSPEPTGMNDGGGDPAWETLSVSCRVNWSWLDIFFGAANAPELKPRTRLNMLKSLIAHAEHLARWEGHGNNWIIVESQAVACCGILFPELKKSAKWREVGLARLERELQRQVWPDGVQKEVSLGYHWMSGQGFADFMTLARENNVALPPDFARTIEKMAEYPLFLARPDGSQPSFNDSGDCIGNAHRALAFGAKEFGRKDMLWLCTDRREGNEPGHASHAFLDAGIYVMRSDWSRHAHWLAFRGGNIGAGHMHEDRLGFDLAVCGTPIIVDPGAANYKPDDLRTWSISTSAHNTATIDNQGQFQRNRPWAERTASVRALNFWHSTPQRDVAAARYGGPYGEGGKITDVSHHREIHFIKPHFWLIADLLVSRQPHTANFFFHFMPMVVRMAESERCIYSASLHHPNLEIRGVNWPNGAKIALLCGSLNPPQGWVSLEREWRPAPCVQLDVQFEGNLALLTLLIPLAAGLRSEFKVVHEGPTRWRVISPHGVYVVTLMRATFSPDEVPVKPCVNIELNPAT